MAFPIVESVIQTQFSVAGTSHDVAMPATVNAGDLLIILFCTPSNPTHTEGSGEWTQLFTGTGSSDFNQFTAWAKEADGSEGGTPVSITLSASHAACAQVYRISSWLGVLATSVESTTFVTTGNANPDPPSETAPWGAQDNLWIACTGAGDDDATITVFPTNYDDNQTSTISGAGLDAGATIGSATRNLAAATDDPGTFTLSESESWVAATIVVRPVAVGTPWLENGNIIAGKFTRTNDVRREVALTKEIFTVS